MKFGTCFLFCVLTLISAHRAHAAQAILTISPVSTPQLQDPATDDILASQFQMIGRGIMDRKNGLAILLICVGDKDPKTNIRSCNRLQHALIWPHGEGQSGLIGPVYQVTKNDLSSSPQDQTMKKIMKDYRKSIRYDLAAPEMDADRRSPNDTRAFIEMIIGIVGGATLSCLTVNPIPALIMIPLLSTDAFTQFSTRMFVGFFRSQKVVQMDNRNGWNWSSHPRKVSDHSFYHYLEYLYGN